MRLEILILVLLVYILLTKSKQGQHKVGQLKESVGSLMLAWGHGIKIII